MSYIDQNDDTVGEKLLVKTENPSNLTAATSNTSELKSQLHATDSGQNVPLRETSIKWLVLFLASSMLIGAYMSYDYPAFLQSQIELDMFGYNGGDKDSPGALNAKIKYNWLYSIYSFPNFILPFFGGYFIDKIGVRAGNLLFNVSICIGQFICAFSKKFSGCIVITKWFYGKQYSFAMSLRLLVGRLGTITAGWILPILYLHYQNGSLFLPLYVCAWVCFSGLIMALLVNIIDKKADNQIEQQTKKTDDGEHKVPVSMRDITKFPALYWLITINCLINYTCDFVQLQLTADLLQFQYRVPKEEAGRLIAIPYLMSAFLAPLLGFIVDRVGNRQWFLFGAAVFMFIGSSFWLMVPVCPDIGKDCTSFYYIFPLILLGFGYSIFATVTWPSIPIILKENLTGTGFGVCQSLVNFALFTFQLLVGFIQGVTTHNRGGYFWSGILSGLNIIFSLLIISSNKRRGNILGRINLNAQEKAQAMKSSFFLQN